MVFELSFLPGYFGTNVNYFCLYLFLLLNFFIPHGGGLSKRNYKQSNDKLSFNSPLFLILKIDVFSSKKGICLLIFFCRSLTENTAQSKQMILNAFVFCQFDSTLKFAVLSLNMNISPPKVLVYCLILTTSPTS